MNEESQTRSPSATARHPAADRHAAAAAGRFELLAEIGSGSSSTVHKARLSRPYRGLAEGAEVAVKFLRPELLADERAIERFYAEGELGQQLRHENLAAIHGVETAAVGDAEVRFLVMQYVEGTTLRQFLGQSERPVEDLARRLGADAAAGLFALHRRGLVHRDIKPENLILTPASKLKIVDLGLVRPFGARGAGSGHASDVSSGFGLAGSVAYAAPETLRGDRGGPRSDLYSLGVVLYELTTGRHPFAQCKTADEMLDAHLHAQPVPPTHLRPGLSPFFSQVILELLHKDPDRRPRDAGELHRILAQGEQSEYWRRLESQEPVRASRRRLLRMRRQADTAFFGRDEEVDRLDAAFAAARSGRGAVVLVTGPHGSGRRRLCDHVMERWLHDEEPPLLLAGEADRDLGHAEPFAGALLDLLLRGDGPDSPAAEARAAAAAAARFQVTGDDATALARVALGQSREDPEVRADRLASALLALPGPHRTVVLRVDLAEQLDTIGRFVLNRLAAAAPAARLLVVLTGDPDAAATAGAVLELSGLDEDAFVAFAKALFRAGEVDDRFVLAAHQTMSGVPGNLLEALEHLAQEGHLLGLPGDYHGLAADADLRPAPGHLARFKKRVAELDAEARAILSAAAVLGRRCLLADLTALLDRGELAVLEALSLFRGRIVRAQGGEVWFRHRDFQKALIDSIPPETRRRLHLEAAALLEARGRSPLEIGMHRSQALDHEGCIAPLLDGLAELIDAGSRRTALRIAARLGVHFAQVADGPTKDRQLLRFHLLHADARRNAGQRAGTLRCYREAESLARRLRDLEASAQARTGLAARELDDGHLLAAISILEGVHDDLYTATGERADHAAAAAHGLHGRILLYRGHAVEGHRHLQAALRRLPPDRDEPRAHLLIDLARLEGLQHHYPTALKTLHRVDKMPMSHHLPRVMLRLHLYRGQVRALLGDDEAAQDLRFAVDEAARLSLPAYGGRAALCLGERQFWRARDDEARELFGLARRLAASVGERLGETMARAYLFWLGAADDELARDVETLGLPSVTANWLLARGARGLATAADRAMLEALVTEADLPLGIHLRALRLAERPAMARSLVRTIAERIPDRGTRRRFLVQWPAGARI